MTENINCVATDDLPFFLSSWNITSRSEGTVAAERKIALVLYKKMHTVRYMFVSQLIVLQ